MLDGYWNLQEGSLAHWQFLFLILLDVLPFSLLETSGGISLVADDQSYGR